MCSPHPPEVDEKVPEREKQERAPAPELGVETTQQESLPQAKPGSNIHTNSHAPEEVGQPGLHWDFQAYQTEHSSSPKSLRWGRINILSMRLELEKC